MKQKWLNREEVIRLRKCCEEREELDIAHGRWLGIRNRALIEFLLGTGFRASECRGTIIGDLTLTFKNGTEPFVKVRTLKRKKKVIDTVTIDRKLAKLLMKYIKELKMFKGKEGVKDSSYLFTGRAGKKLTLVGLEKAVNGIFEKAGINKEHSVHSLRHTHGFYVYHKDKNLKLVQIRLRHTNIQSSSIYTDVEPEEEQRTINGLFDFE
jgi:site-specific recombinase XerD